MKLAVVFVTLSVAVMVILIFQAVRQELIMRNLKTHTDENSAEVKRKEDAIIELKNKIKELKTTLESVNTKMGELKKMKTDAEKSTLDYEKSLQTCNTEKASDTHRAHTHTVAQPTIITLSTRQYHFSGCT